ncbi:MAG: SCO family protein [Castellaniella sp.]
MQVRYEAGYRLLAAMLVVTAGVAALWWGTDGFRAYTSESARRLAVLQAPRALPGVRLQDQDGQVFALGDYQGRLVAIEFIYTRCETICRSLGMLFQQLHDRLPQTAFEQDVVLLSISFDSQRDDARALKRYGETYGADGREWRLARVPDPRALERLMASFGVVAIDDGLGGFEHNAALHLLDRDGRLVLIEDYDELERFEMAIQERL